MTPKQSDLSTRVRIVRESVKHLVAHLRATPSVEQRFLEQAADDLGKGFLELAAAIENKEAF